MIPFFIKEKKDGVLPITDPRMTRFWITLEQGVDFVLKCLETMSGGELFVPKIPSMKITDLATAICPECKMEIVGIRPGEKLHEVMISRDDARNTVEFDDYYIIKPSFRFFQRRFNEQGCRPVPEDFEYSSDTNDKWLSKEDLLNLV